MRPPFDRDRLCQRNALDFEDERAAATMRSPADGLVETIELSEFVRELAAATGSLPDAVHDLEEKARLYVRPLRAALRSKSR